jgi:hypothetical protein
MARKLTDTALVILSAAAARDDHRVLPLPELKAPAVAVTKVLKSLLADSLIEEIRATSDDEAWAQSDQHGRTTLAITVAGLAAIGIEEEASLTKAPKTRTRGKTGAKAVKVAKKAPRARTADTGGKRESKQDVVIALLRRSQGASIEEMMEATGWQAHSVRGFMSGALKKRLGMDVVSEKDAKTGERRYQVVALASKS